MGPAWLDSLSEDWVSQPASEASFAESTPSKDKKPKPKTSASKIPRRSPLNKQYQNPANGNSSNVLIERNVNQRFDSPSRRTPTRTPTKLPKQTNANVNGRDCQACRSRSASTANSVVRRAFLRKSAGPSPGKGRGDTPEWKRRLVYGDLSYGEQRDLFTSAGTGLENIFKPPPPATDSAMENDASLREKDSQLDVTLPSSPPMYSRDPPTAEIHVDESAQELPKRAPTSMRYRRTEESFDASRGSELTVPPEGASQAASMTEQTALSDGRAAESRKVSGRSDMRNEDFSPILLERRQASNGKTVFGPADLPPDELRKRLENLRRDQMLLVGGADEGSSDGPSDNRTNSGHTETTRDFEKLGGFINIQRGGRSGEGSFRNHMLSSALNDTSELLPEESLQASTPKQFPTARIERCGKTERTPADSPNLPPVPHPSPEKRPAPPMHAGTGSPLKLFQPYDTFTSQTLLRRLSQVGEEAGDNSFSIAQDDASKYLWQEESPSRLLPPGAHKLRTQHATAYANWFGAGELDGYEFSEEFSQLNEASGMDGDKENRSPGGDSVLPSHPPIFDLSRNSSPSQAAEIVVHRRRQKSVTSIQSRRFGRASFPPYVELLSTPRRRDADVSDIKRPRTSPSKDPTPKRRRTLHKSDVSYGTDGYLPVAGSVQLSHQQMQSAMDRQRQDSHNSGQHDITEADVAPASQALRPRTPTPSQRSSLQPGRPPLVETKKSPLRSSRHSQPPPTTLNTNRKPSIRTEDFINEANKIMAMIRSKAGLPSGLASLEESHAEHGQPSPDLENSYQESTQEPFSRPPSRDGRPPLTRRSTKQEDPELVERLRQYEEASDMGDIITSSVRSAKPAQEAISAAGEHESESKSAWGSNGSRTSVSDGVVFSDPPNIRISRNPDWQERPSVNGLSDGVPSQGSSGAPSQTTGMSVPTGSSRGSSRESEARKTIAPESVSHLIPDQVGNMVLDRQRNVWVKKKSSIGSGHGKGSVPASEASEEDPFAGIPDLSVDVTTEMQNLRLTGKKESAPRDGLTSAAAQASPSKPPKARPASAHGLNEAVEREIGIDEDRVKEPRRLTISFSSPVASVIQDAAGDNSVSSENVSLLEQTAEDLPRDPSLRGRRSVSNYGTTGSRSSQSRSTLRGPARHLSVRGHPLLARPVSRIDEQDEESVPDQAQYQEAASGMELSVLAEQSLVSRDADSGRRASLSILVATPARDQECPVAGLDAAPIISQYVGTFSLSPLSEFTVHRGEETLPLEASYVVGNHHLVTGDKSRRVMSMSMRELVAKLAEVEPFELYWEDMRELDLRDKGLGALHALDEFCGRLESLDVSKNSIRNLGGIPASVRYLRITDNQLSSLTAWNHLMNLQYLDVSNNGLTSLAALKNLVHLRSLRADDNQITSLDGIKFHKGLQILRARGNRIEEVDFDGSTMEQLTELDLKDNRIRRIANLNRLPALNSLNLERNQLERFEVGPSDDQQPSPSSLRYLRLDDNKLSSLDVKLVPHLRLLHADRNSLVRIAGLSRARRIDSLSLREQRGQAPLDVAHLLSRAYEVRKLYLSGNLLGGWSSSSSSFAPQTDLLNLQLLELANCGLSSLPPDLGLMLPNLRVLNLNMNALADLAPLRAVPRLKRVFVAGNRIADAAALVGVLAQFRCLVQVDVRDNPVTQGFYAPVGLQVQVVQQQKQKQQKGGGDDGIQVNNPFVLPDQDAERDERYCARLDLATRMRRRVYESLVRERCRRVRRLDGLALRLGRRGGDVDGEEGEGRDAVWEALRERGIVLAREAADGGEEGDHSGRWPAEDSFE
ncbi:hypothetical protein VTK56DRAFT_7990 [Thermocarpiscus australiensis]